MLSVVGAMAQKKNGTVTGSVADATSGEVVIGASVALYSLPDTVLAVGVATSYDGSFTLSAKPAKYLLRFSYVGYETK